MLAADVDPLCDDEENSVASDSKVYISDAENPSAVKTAEALNWFSAQLLGCSVTEVGKGGALPVLDLTVPADGELLPHQKDGVGHISQKVMMNSLRAPTAGGEENGGARVLVAFASTLRLLTRSDDDILLGIEGGGALLGGIKLPTAVPLRIPFSSCSDVEHSLATLAAETRGLLLSGVVGNGPHLGSLGALADTLGVAASSSHHSMFQALVVFEDDCTKTCGKALAGPLVRCPSRNSFDSTPLSLVLVVRLGSDVKVAGRQTIHLQLVYPHRFVTRSFALALMNHLCRQIQDTDWQQRLSSLPLSCDSEIETVLSSWSVGPHASLDEFTKMDGGDLCVHELFERSVQETPFAPALIDGTPGSSSMSLSYVAMSSWTTCLMQQIRATRVHPGDIVALLFERSPAMVVAIYATLQSGCCYCPLDPKWPADRLASVLESANASVAICLRHLEAPLLAAKCPNLEIIVVEGNDAAIWADASEMSSVPIRGSRRPVSNDPCYVFFTSGSTGKPKGVVVEHRGLVHRVRWLQHDYKICPGDHHFLKHAYTFGLSEWEIFWPLSYGAAVVTLTPDGERDATYLASLYQRHHSPVSVFVPSALQFFLENLEADGSSGAAAAVQSATQQIIACGEPLRSPLVHLAHRLLPKAQISNVFGPTEGEMTHYVCPRGRTMQTVPVGHPIDGSTAYVLGPRGQPCGAYVPGELHFAGPFIARGYLSQPELTAEKFVRDPISRTLDSNAKMYKTGDLVRWLPNGELLFVGRADHQVKIRGFRIELGDIEAAVRVAGEAAIREAIAIVDASRGTGSERLVVHVGLSDAYCTPAQVHSLEQRLMEECKSKLPAYMVPNLVVAHASLPRNANGKVDRRALVTPRETLEAPVAETDQVNETPLSAVEEQVREVWAKVLNVGPRSINIAAGFFAALGGNSLLAGRVTAGIRQKFHVDLPGTAMYTHSTIERLSKRIEALLQSKQPGDHATINNSDMKHMDILAKYPTSHYHGLSSTQPLVLIFQGLSVLALEVGCDLGPHALAYILFSSLYYRLGFHWILIVILPLVAALEILTVAVSTIMLKWLILGRLTEGHYPLWGSTYLRWWLVDRILNESRNTLGAILGDSPLLQIYYRLLGANITGPLVGPMAPKLNNPKLMAPDLVDIGPKSDVRRGSILGCTAVYGGMLHVSPVSVGAGCRIDPGSYVAPGTVLAPNSRVLPMAKTCGHLGGTPEKSVVNVTTQTEDTEEFISSVAIDFMYQQDRLRLLIGLPWVLGVMAFPYLGVLMGLSFSWNLCEMIFEHNAWPVFWYIAVPLLCSHGASICLIASVVLQKRLFIGRLGPGTRIGPPREGASRREWAVAHWDTLRRWVYERWVTSHNYKLALDALVNTELLSVVHRLLGAKVGRRVQSDNFETVDHDCIDIEDFAVFGSAVQAHCDSYLDGTSGQRELRAVRLMRLANCLDHSLLMPGVVVGEGAVLGTKTLGHEGACFPPDSISTGAVAGQSVLLRLDAAESSAKKDRELELATMRRLESSSVWITFNCIQLLSATFAYALPHLAWVISTSVLWSVTGTGEENNSAGSHSSWDSDLSPNEASVKLNDTPEGTLTHSIAIHYFAYAAVWLATFCAAEFALLFLQAGMKWVLIGRYKEENHAFFSSFHLRWAVMMNIKGAMSSLSEQLHGTAFQAWYYRCMGSQIGTNVYLAGLALEYDLLDVGDGAAVNEDCDTTAHTVERMVLKMAPVRASKGSALLTGSVVMPGGELEQGALLLEHSQVLKGDAARAGEVWAGLPARRIYNCPVKAFAEP